MGEIMVDDDVLSFIMGSERRQDVLLALSQKRMTVPQFSNEFNLSPTGLYRTFNELNKKGLITHNNVSRHRIYSITDKGIELLKYIGVIK